MRHFATQLGQIRKCSPRAHVFRCYSSNGHTATTTACPFGAKLRHYGCSKSRKKKPPVGGFNTNLINIGLAALSQNKVPGVQCVQRYMLKHELVAVAKVDDYVVSMLRAMRF